MKLLKQLYLANAIAADGSPPTPYRIGHGGLSRSAKREKAKTFLLSAR